MSPTETFLKNKTILVTRPLGRETNLIKLINRMGGHAKHYPSIEITPIPLDSSAIKQLSTADIIIFISPSSVLQSIRVQSHIKPKTKIAAIGSKTEQTLLENHFHVSITNSGHDTQSLLTHNELQSQQVNNKNIIIIRGKGGRADLGDTLISRGAKLSYFEIYRRDLPNIKPLSINDLKILSAITISSNDGLTNLMKLTNHSTDILSIPIIVPSKIAADSAKRYNFHNIIQADNATDEACMLMIKELFISH